jgi:hypothetical protein
MVGINFIQKFFPDPSDLSVRYYLKKGADPIIRSNNNAYTLLHVASFLAKDILKLTNYSSITKRWTSTTWTTAGETLWITQNSTNMDKERELLID